MLAENAQRIEHGLRRAGSRLSGRGDVVDELSREIERLEPWYQPIHLGHGLVTPARDKGGRRYWPKGSRDRGLGKWRSFIEPNLPLDLAGARVAEVGCNAGLNLLTCLRAGAREAIGLEIDDHYFEQAHFVRGAIERLEGRYVPLRVYQGAMEDFEWPLAGRFDLALLLNVIYHVGRYERERKLDDEATFARQVEAVQRVAAVARHLVFAANPWEDEGYGKGIPSLHAILDAAGVEVEKTASYRHPRGYVAVVRSPAYREDTADVPLERMVNKYFLPPARSAEKELADVLADGGEPAGTRYHRLRTAAEDWTAPGQADLPAGLDGEPRYWVMPWACKPRRFDSSEREARERAFPDLVRRFRELMASLGQRGLDPSLGGRVRAYRLIDPERGEVYQYIDGNQRVGIVAHLAERRGGSPLVPVVVEQDVERDRLLELPLCRQLIAEGALTEADARRWFDQAFAAVAARPA